MPFADAHCVSQAEPSSIMQANNYPLKKTERMWRMVVNRLMKVLPALEVLLFLPTPAMKSWSCSLATHLTCSSLDLRLHSLSLHNTAKFSHAGPSDHFTPHPKVKCLHSHPNSHSTMCKPHADRSTCIYLTPLWISPCSHPLEAASSNLHSPTSQLD